MPLQAGQDPRPTDFFSNYASDGVNITIPIADIAGLTAAEADAATGNAAELLHKLLQSVGATIESAAEADRPPTMVYTAGDLDPQTGGGVRIDYNFNFLLALNLSSANVESVA